MEFTEESKPNVQVSATTSGVSNSLSEPFKPSPSSPSFVNSSQPSPRIAGHDHVINPDNNDDDGDSYFNNFPAGYRFCPHNHELVLHYLKNKVSGLPLPRNRIADVSLYQHNPEELAGSFLLILIRYCFIEFDMIYDHLVSFRLQVFFLLI